MAAMNNPRYVIVRAATTAGLVYEVDPKLEGGIWRCIGSPFWEDAPERILGKKEGMWCQALERRDDAPLPAGKQVKLREPAR